MTALSPRLCGFLSRVFVYLALALGGRAVWAIA